MLSEKQFLDEQHTIRQLTDGFSFGTDAVLLSGFIRCRAGQVGCELGTGTGIIPLLLSIHKEFRKLYAIEIQPEYARLAAQNLADNGFSDRVEVIRGDLKEAAALVGEKCDFVFSNPPYLKKNAGKENDSDQKRIARHEIFCDIFDVCAAASSLLQDKGNFYCIYRTERLSDLFDALRRSALEPKLIIPVQPKPDAEPSLILVRAVKAASPSLICRQPFVIGNDRGERSSECQRLYETGKLSHGRGE